MKNESIFRSKNMENISSMDKMDDYIHVTSPAGWMTITAIILILISFFTFCVLVRVESPVVYYGICENNELTIYVPVESISEISNQQFCIVEDKDCSVEKVDSIPIQAREINQYICELNSFSADDWVCGVVINSGDVKEGIIEAKFKGEAVRPIDYLIN